MIFLTGVLCGWVRGIYYFFFDIKLTFNTKEKYPQIMIDSCGEGGYGGRGT
jgi:hypothetical protein